ncbi:hypothetical protein Sbs19_21570 [Sphingobium sp. BS19]|nr:hypothetical protein Sbs19_21570 [Sphingobium sp. BS19]
MADIEIWSSHAAARITEIREDRTDPQYGHVPLKSAYAETKDREKAVGLFRRQDTPKATALYDCLGLGAKMFEIGKAHMVYPRRHSANPDAPDQAAYV